MRISRNLAVCMVNADMSGLNDEEVKLCEAFPDFSVDDWHEESSDINGICSITKKWDHCVDITVNKRDEK